MPQSAYAKPGPYITQLPAADEATFQSWVKQNHVPFDPSPKSDYDMRGYYKDNVLGGGGVKTKTSAFDGLPHFPDTYKTPYHKTFSNESRYATTDAPHWEGDVLKDKRGNTVADETPKTPQVQQAQSDPWEEAAKQFKGATPAQGGQPQSAPAPNEDWKVWQGSQPQTAEKPGFFKSLGQSLGIDPEATKQNLTEHPIRSIIEAQPPVAAAEGLYSGGKRILGELGQAGKSIMNGNLPDAAVHGISAIPFIGEGLNKAADQAPASTPGESYLGRVKDAATDPGVLGTVAGTAIQATPAVEGGLGALDRIAPTRGVIGRIPTRAHAGQLFESVMKDAGDLPVNLTRSLPILERAQQLSERGHGSIGALDNLYKRVNTVNPLDYREARDRASAISSLTGQDKMAATRTLQREAKNFSHAFNQDVGDTPASVGHGENYNNALKEYRRASQIRSGLVGAAKYGVPAAVGTGIAGKLIRDLLP